MKPHIYFRNGKWWVGLVACPSFKLACNLAERAWWRS